MSENQPKKFIGHIVREDPNGDKEDTRPVEKIKKPAISIDYKKLQRWIEE